MFTKEGLQEYNKWKKWVGNDECDFRPDFVPTEDTPQGAIDYYKDMLSEIVDFDDPNFTWPTGVTINC